MKKLTTALLTGSALLLFTACGGGGGDNGGGNNPPPTTTTKYDVRSFIDTASLLIDMEGTYNGSPTEQTFENEYLGTIQYDGLTMNEHLVTYSYHGAISSSASSYTYMGNLHYQDSYGGICTIEAGFTPTPIPESVEVGFQSDVIPMDCGNGHLEVSFEVKDGGGDNALIVATNKDITAGNMTQSFSLVDPNMNLLEYRVEGDNFDFEATDITQY